MSPTRWGSPKKAEFTSCSIFAEAPTSCSITAAASDIDERGSCSTSTRRANRLGFTGSCPSWPTASRRAGRSSSSLEIAGALDGLAQLAPLAGLGDELVGDVHQPAADLFLRLARQDDAHHVRVVLLDPAQQRGPVHLGHAHVRDDDVVRRRGQLAQRLGAAGHEGHVPVVALLAQQPAQAGQHAGLVIHEQDALHAPP